MAILREQSEPSRSKAVAYVRISSERQKDNESIATQREVIQRYADANGIEIVAWFEDIAKSGKNADRTGLQELIQYCMKHKDEIDNWLVYNMKRASRDTDTYALEVRAVLKKAGITVRSATETGVNDSKEGRMLETILVALGQLDNEGKAEVTRDNMRALALQGYWQHPPLLGYDPLKKLNEFGKPRPTLKQNNKSPLVAQVLVRYSLGDITKADLARFASSIGLRSRNGKKLTESRIDAMLRHPVYAGFVQDTHTGGELIKGVHEPIISHEIFELNQRLLNKKNARTGQEHIKRNPQYPLKGLLLCSNCHLPLYASAPKTGSGSKSPRYHCARPQCKGKTKSVAANTVHGDFHELLKRIKPDAKVVELYREVLIKEAANHLGSLNSQIAEARRQLDSIAELRLTAIKNFNLGSLTLDEKNEILESYDEDKAVQSNELAKLEKQQQIQEADIDLAIDTMLNIDVQWETVGIEAKQRFQSLIFPEGLTYDSVSGRFGTVPISDLYRCIPIEKGSEEPSKSVLVAGAGLEPATSWL